MTKPCFKWCCFLLLLSISAGLSLPSIFNNGQHNHSILTANVEALVQEEEEPEEAIWVVTKHYKVNPITHEQILVSMDCTSGGGAYCVAD